MSFAIHLMETVTMEVDHFDCCRVTYNYSKFYHQCLDKELGIRWLYGKTGRQVIGRLKRAIRKLGVAEVSDDFVAITPENAGLRLVELLEHAKKYPNAVFDGD